VLDRRIISAPKGLRACGTPPLMRNAEERPTRKRTFATGSNGSTFDFRACPVAIEPSRAAVQWAQAFNVSA